MDCSLFHLTPEEAKYWNTKFLFNSYGNLLAEVSVSGYKAGLDRAGLAIQKPEKLETSEELVQVLQTLNNLAAEVRRALKFKENQDWAIKGLGKKIDTLYELMVEESHVSEYDDEPEVRLKEMRPKEKDSDLKTISKTCLEILLVLRDSLPR